MVGGSLRTHAERSGSVNSWLSATRHSMARKPRYKRTGNAKFQVLNIEQNLSLGTLGALTTIAASLTNFGETKFRVVACDIFWGLDDVTSGEGPIAIGIHNNDLNVTEINECLDAKPTSSSDIVARERL